MKQLIVFALTMASPAAAQLSDSVVGAAQGAMLNREEKAIRKFLDTYKLDDMYAAYCRAEMTLHTKDAPTGSIPHGVNWRTIPDQKTLDLIIYNREAYETAYMTLCMAKALKALDGVNAFEKFEGLQK